MTSVFLMEIGLKSFVTAGITLLLVQLFWRRSASERSLVAHAGLAATLLLPILTMTLPRLPVEASAAATLIEPAEASTYPTAVAEPVATSAAAAVRPFVSSETLVLIAYGLPASLLGLLTIIAVARLFMIRRRAGVITDPLWLRALALAQRRMGFKNGAALLMSCDLSSPVSWGLFRPTIVISRRGVASAQEAEAIIAHELAHVLRWDWLKLLAARAATAFYWFNPFVWLLARQCHQLREEAADDTVLLCDLGSADYAALLVASARHEAKGVVLAANGVAPSGGSLKRRVTRVLDAGLRRTPAGPGWRSGVAACALLICGPVAAITPIPTTPALAAVDRGDPQPSTQSQVSHSQGRLIPLPPFQSLEATAGAQVVLRHGAAFGARGIAHPLDTSRLVLGPGRRLTVLPCTTHCGNEGAIIEVVAPSIDEVAVQGGGSLVAHAGFRPSSRLAAAIYGGGTIDARALPVDEALTAVAAGGTILIQPRIALTASINGGGAILYGGDPVLTQTVSGGGSVRRIGGT